MPAAQYREKEVVVWALKYILTNGQEMKDFAPNAIRLDGADTYLTQYGQEDLMVHNQWVLKSPTGDFTSMMNRQFAILYEVITP